MYGANGCHAKRPSGFAIHMIFGASAIMIALWDFSMGIYLFISLKRHGRFKCNAMGSTLILNILSGFPLFFWPLGYFLSAIEGGKLLREAFAGPALPALGFCLISACLNISLMWMQVGQSAKSLKASGSNIAKSKWCVCVCVCVLGGREAEGNGRRRGR
jgi:hypothetical protein